MEALALLKQWRRRRVSITTPTSASTTRSNSNSATIADDDEDSSTSAEDEGPFFDLEFEMPEEAEECKQEDEGGEEKCGEVGKEEGEEEKEFIFPVSTGEDDAHLSLQLSPSDDLFFKGRLEVPLTNNDEVYSSSSNSSLSTDVPKPLFLPISFLKSATATRLRVLVSGLKKPKSTNTGNEDKRRRNPKRQFLTVKFKVDDLRVPIVSLFSREATSRRSGTKPPPKDTNTEPDSPVTPSAEVVLTVEKDEEKRFARELVQKYLEKIRPLYMKVYKKDIAGGVDNPPSTTSCVAAVVAEEESTSASSETVESESESSPDEVVEEGLTSTPPPVVGRRAQKFAQVASHLPSGLKVAVKNLVKNSKPSFSPPATASPTSVLVRRRDDSLLQQQDGIQSAIAHCKQSLHSNRVSDLENPTTMTASDVMVAEIKRGDDRYPTIDP